MLTDGTFNDHDHVDQSLEDSPPQLTEFVLNFLEPWMLQPFLCFYFCKVNLRKARYSHALQDLKPSQKPISVRFIEKHID